VNIAMGNYDKALEDLTMVIAIAPQYAKAYADRACVHYKMGNKGLAKADIAKAERMAPNDGWVLGVKDKIENE
jgi:Tfp pilus assembly protein PilF